jgi:hypothetical protein
MNSWVRSLLSNTILENWKMHNAGSISSTEGVIGSLLQDYVQPSVNLHTTLHFYHELTQRLVAMCFTQTLRASDKRSLLKYTIVLSRAHQTIENFKGETELSSSRKQFNKWQAIFKDQLLPATPNTMQ